MLLINSNNIPTVDSFLRLFGEIIVDKFTEIENLHNSDRKFKDIEFLPLDDSENEYQDVVVRLGNRIYISDRMVGQMGFTPPELFAIFAHELGHILYNTHPWACDSESRADTLAAELGLGEQMISVLEKIISSRRFRQVTSDLVRRIQFLSHIA